MIGQRERLGEHRCGSPTGRGCAAPAPDAGRSRLLQPGALVKIERDSALLIVIAEPVVEPHRPLAPAAATPLRARRPRYPPRCGCGSTQLHVRPAQVDRAVDHEPGVVRLVLRRLDLVPLVTSILIRFDAAISSNISPIGLMRNWSVVPGTRAELCVRIEIVPFEIGDQPIGRREIDANLPLLGIDMRGAGRKNFERIHALLQTDGRRMG